MPDKDLTLRITLRPGDTAQQPVTWGSSPSDSITIMRNLRNVAESLKHKP